jgi:cytoskeletal protein CcmA (bactofilin family)
MSAAASRLPQPGTLYIGEGVTIKGAVVVPGTVVVDGLLEGDIDVDNLLLRARGTVTGRIRVAKNAEISGRVLDRLEVKGLLVLRAGGRIEGNTRFGTLTIEPGANITGEVSSVDYRANFQSSYRASPPSPLPAPVSDARPADPAPSLRQLDLSALDEMPGPIAATG